MEAPKATAPTKPSISIALSRAAMLAGAAGLAAPLAVQADGIVYSGPQDITETSTLATGDQLYTVSLAGDTMSSYTFTASSSPTSKQVYVTPAESTSFYVADGSAPNANPTALSSGSVINRDSTFSGGMGNIQETSAVRSGNWPADGTPAFLGVEFTDTNPAVGSSPDQTYCGWVELGATTTSTSAAFTIDGWAYNAGGCPIQAGETQAGETTPEPDSLALFALGAAGIAAFRARRKSSRA